MLKSLPLYLFLSQALTISDLINTLARSHTHMSSINIYVYLSLSHSRLAGVFHVPLSSLTAIMLAVKIRRCRLCRLIYMLAPEKACSLCVS